MARIPLKRWLHFAGGGLGLAGVGFVAIRLHSYADQIDVSRFDVGAWLGLVLLALAYGAVNVLLARAWWCLLLFLDVKVGWKWAVKAYGLSQLAKYVPGNIFHLAGRQALGMAAGLPAGALARSAVCELGLIAVAGALFGVLAVPLVWKTVPPTGAVFLFIAVSVALFTVLWNLLSRSVAVALLWQMVFLALSGLVFVGGLSVVVPETAAVSALPALCGAYIVAWLAGLITPGAPAGVGVREMLLLFLLNGQLAPADLLLAVVLGRGVTVVGDLGYFAISALLLYQDK